MQQNICKPTSVLYFYKFIGQQPENSILKLEQIIYEKNKLTVVPTRSQNKLYDFLNILEPPRPTFVDVNSIPSFLHTLDVTLISCWHISHQNYAKHLIYFVRASGRHGCPFKDSHRCQAVAWKKITTFFLCGATTTFSLFATKKYKTRTGPISSLVMFSLNNTCQKLNVYYLRLNKSCFCCKKTSTI
jgi:hypothetical protein